MLVACRDKRIVQFCWKINKKLEKDWCQKLHFWPYLQVNRLFQKSSVLGFLLPSVPRLLDDDKRATQLHLQSRFTFLRVSVRVHVLLFWHFNIGSFMILYMQRGEREEHITLLYTYSNGKVLCQVLSTKDTCPGFTIGNFDIWFKLL